MLLLFSGSMGQSLDSHSMLLLMSRRGHSSVEEDDSETKSKNLFYWRLASSKSNCSSCYVVAGM